MEKEINRLDMFLSTARMELERLVEDTKANDCTKKLIEVWEKQVNVLTEQRKQLAG